MVKEYAVYAFIGILLSHVKQVNRIICCKTDRAKKHRSKIDTHTKTNTTCFSSFVEANKKKSPV